MDDVITQGWAHGGTCMRIKFQCLPYGITLNCSGFLLIYVLLMPLGLITDASSRDGLYQPTFALVVYFVLCVMLLGADEVATQLEQPFPFIPLVDIADTTLRDVSR
jgi:ion channel-forming bestrophin family protein